MMNLADYASNLYSAYHSNPSGNYVRTPEEKSKLDNLSREEFVADMLKTHRERWASGGEMEAMGLFVGRAERTKLSDTEIAVLSNKYDLKNLDQKTYDAFLDDLADMGAISEREKGYLGYGGLTTAGYFNASGELILTAHSTGAGSGTDLLNAREDLVNWLKERVKWQAECGLYASESQRASGETAAKRENEMIDAFSRIVSRMTAMKPERTEAKTPLEAAQRRVRHEVAPGEFMDTSGLVSRKYSFWNSDRPRLSDNEIGQLAMKYDFRHMNQASYDEFLEEMVEKGVLTQDEIKWFGYGGTVETVEADGEVMIMTMIDQLVKETPTSVEYTSQTYWSDGSGKAYGGSKYGQHTPFLEDGVEGSGDMFAWMEEMLLSVEYWPKGASQEVKDRAVQRCEMYSILNDILTRAEGVWNKDETPDIVNQILDPNSRFYEGMYNRMKLQLQESKEEKEKQAIIDALDAILESLCEKKDGVPKKKTTVKSMAELSQVIDSLDRKDPRKEQLNLLRERLQTLGIYADLDVGIKDKDGKDETLTESLIREETEDLELGKII